MGYYENPKEDKQEENYLLLKTNERDFHKGE